MSATNTYCSPTRDRCCTCGILLELCCGISRLRSSLWLLTSFFGENVLGKIVKVDLGSVAPPSWEFFLKFGARICFKTPECVIGGSRLSSYLVDAAMQVGCGEAAWAVKRHALGFPAKYCKDSS